MKTFLELLLLSALALLTIAIQARADDLLFAARKTKRVKRFIAPPYIAQVTNCGTHGNPTGDCFIPPAPKGWDKPVKPEKKVKK